MENRVQSSPLAQLRDEMDRMFQQWFTGEPLAWSGQGGSRGFPALCEWEEGDDLLVEAELPGLKAENLEVSVVGDVLTLKGRRGENGREGAAYHRRERGVGEFSRVLRLPVPVEADQVQANLKDGVLLVRLPKAASARPRKIAVAGG